MLSLPQIRQHLAAHAPTRYAESHRFAAVAMVLHATYAGVEMLIIRRARHNDDPWSGDLAFPGGKIDAGDASPRAAAERETLEEIGLDLQQAEYLGQLDDLTGARLPVCVSAFVYALESAPSLLFNNEVTDSWWLPLEIFHEPHRHSQRTFPTRSHNSLHPVIDLIADAPVLWGITFRLIENFFAIIDTPLPNQK